MTEPTMHKRFLAITVLTAALLFSQGGNFLIAALCPHLGSGMASCMTKLGVPTMSHEDMGQEGMEHMGMQSEPSTNDSPDAVALGQPIGPCSHCAVHSRTTPNTASLRDTEAAKRLGDLNIPFSFPRVAAVTMSPVPVLTSRAHGPPGDPAARHLLINIFRI